MFRITAGVVFIHAAWFAFSGPSITRGDVGDAHRVAVLVGDDGVGVVLGLEQLVVGANGVRLAIVLQLPFGLVDIDLRR